MHKCGTQTSMRIGSIIMTVGLYVSAYTPSLELMFFTFGIVVGKADSNGFKYTFVQGGRPSSCGQSSIIRYNTEGAKTITILIYFKLTFNLPLFHLQHAG